MSENRKEEIILATLKLASEKGLAGVSMNMIAESIGIKKPSLYNHFKSKDELVNFMYEYLRETAKKTTKTEFDMSILDSKSASEILQTAINNYIMLSSDKNMEMFYKVIYSERAISQNASNIMIIETEKMIQATKFLFFELQKRKLLEFKNLELSATSFALTIHAIMDYEADKSFSKTGKITRETKLLNDYIDTFCDEHKVKE